MTRRRLRKLGILAIFLFPIMNIDAKPQKIVDLSHALDAETIYWPTETGFVLEKEFERTGITKRKFRISPSGKNGTEKSPGNRSLRFAAVSENIGRTAVAI